MRLVNDQDKLREEYREWANEMYEDVCRIRTEGRDGFFIFTVGLLRDDIVQFKQFCDGHIELSENDIDGLIYTIQDGGHQLMIMQREEEDIKPKLEIIE